ncbi:NAD(P)-dependent alcohol dehydrogenase [Arenicella sp. 4NH20-0111]|uniref:NADPH-dependent aldehyde reductase Ahr n=1 Tax=Arenicella sp. 4NH20-0111 TaxID=3127648 RepID=UPI00310854CE
MIRSLAVDGPNKPLKPMEFDPGVLPDNQVEIEVQYCGVCHSDLSMMDNEWGASRYPLVPGHEVVGKVVKTGSMVRSLQAGDSVGLGWHSDYCEQCTYCHSGEHNLCSASQPTIIGRHGGFADRVRASETAVVPLPPGIDLKSAGPLFCGGITVYNPIVQFQIKPTDKVAVIGIGGLGHLALQFLSAWGCDVTAFSSNPDKAEQAKALGASHILDSTDIKQLDSARDKFDFIICTVNVELNWTGYLNTLAPKGRLHFVGVIPTPIAISVGSMLGKQLQISASPVGSPATISEMLNFAVRHDIKPMVEVFPFDQANAAIEKLRAGRVRYRAVLEL